MRSSTNAMLLLPLAAKFIRRHCVCCASCRRLCYRPCFNLDSEESFSANSFGSQSLWICLVKSTILYRPCAVSQYSLVISWSRHCGIPSFMSSYGRLRVGCLTSSDSSQVQLCAPHIERFRIRECSFVSSRSL